MSLKEFFEDKVFECRKCTIHDPSLKLMNPYRDKNEKILENEPDSFCGNRRRFLLDYLSNMLDTQVMIIGEAPGLDGCGFSGIPFTSEENAVNELDICNYHQSAQLQSEDSSNALYEILRMVSRRKSVSISELSRKIYLTNSCMCVPLADNRKSVTSPSPVMKNSCSRLLDEQIRLCAPNVIITLGNIPYVTVRKLLGLKGTNNSRMKVKDMKSVTECARNGMKYVTLNGITLIPEIHPSPVNKPLQGKLWEELPTRMIEYLDAYIT